MAGNPQVLGLLEEMLDSEKTPEEVCRDCPDLLPAVQDQWEEFCRIDAEVEALLPGPGSPPIADSIIPAAPAACLPQVPGYELEAVLGRGGMGVVFKARHLTLKRVVALKMLLAGAYARPEELARFRREAEAVAALRHPNIVPVHDAGDITGRPYFTMEYVEGGSLAQSLAGKPQPPRRAAPRHAGVGRPVRAQERLHPPRPQAGQRPAHGGRRAEDHRFRPGPVDRRGPRGDAERRLPRHALLHGPGTSAGP